MSGCFERVEFHYSSTHNVIICVLLVNNIDIFLCDHSRAEKCCVYFGYHREVYLRNETRPKCVYFCCRLGGIGEIDFVQDSIHYVLDYLDRDES